METSDALKRGLSGALIRRVVTATPAPGGAHFNANPFGGCWATSSMESSRGLSRCQYFIWLSR